MPALVSMSINVNMDDDDEYGMWSRSYGYHGFWQWMMMNDEYLRYLPYLGNGSYLFPKKNTPRSVFNANKHQTIQYTWAGVPHERCKKLRLLSLPESFLPHVPFPISIHPAAPHAPLGFFPSTIYRINQFLSLLSIMWRHVLQDWRSLEVQSA